MFALRTIRPKRPVSINRPILKPRYIHTRPDIFVPPKISPTQTSTRDPKIISKVCTLRQHPAINDAELINHYPLTTNNNLDLLIDGDKAFASLQNELEKATSSIHMSYFQFLNDETGNKLAETLIQKAQQGIKVRIITDSIGSHLYTSFTSSEIFDRLRVYGVDVINVATLTPTATGNTYLEPPDHRKIVVIDGTVGFTGGMNIGDHYRFDWHDLMIKVSGSAVHQMQLEWIQSWMQNGGLIDKDLSHEDFINLYFPATPAAGSVDAKICQGLPSLHGEIRSTAFTLINQAKNSLYISSPYISDPTIYNALIKAAERGVKVSIFTPTNNNSITNAIIVRSWYSYMLNAGIRVYEYPGMSHLKCLLVDDEFVSIGSSNFDGLSLYHIKEMNLYIEDQLFANNLKDSLFEKDINNCKNITNEDVSNVYWLAGCLLTPFTYVM